MADARLFQWEYRPEPVAREVFRVDGGRPLSGTVSISGSKNAALKLMAAATLTGERCRFTNVPEIEDVRAMAQTLQDLGVVVDHPEPNVYEIASGDVEWLFVPLEAAARMRASFILLGPLLSRFGQVIISNPGGDRIGRRPVNLHVDAMRALGASIEYRNGYYFARSPGRLRGTEVTFPQVTVMGTENAMLAAVLAEGHTIIRPAAREPEVDDLIAFLRKMGAEIDRTAPDTIEIEGRKRLRGADHQVVADRIEAGTFVVAAGVTGGRVRLEAAPCDHLAAFLEVLDRVGLGVRCDGDTIEVDGSCLETTGFTAADIETAPYPGVATDLQPPLCVLLSQARGTSNVHETVFEDRLDWLSELVRMGADVAVLDNHHATISGPTRLHGADVEIGDLRAGASLILAALAAPGRTTIHGAHHVQRGYENIEAQVPGPWRQDRARRRRGSCKGRMKIGIDLGTANVLVYVEGKGIVIQEPSVVAVSDDNRIVAVGEEAREMIGRTPGNITAIRPMKDGVIADYVITEAMLSFFIKKVTRRMISFRKPDVMISVPAGVTSVEKRAVRDAAIKAGARAAYLIEEPLAAAIGANVPISGPSGNMIIDIGGGTSEIAVIALGGIVVSTSLRVGGNRFDEAIATYIRKKYNLMVGERTAEEVKIQIGTALPLERELQMEVRGRDLIAGLPRTIPITSSEVMEAIESPLQQLVAAVRLVLEQTPPELSSDIIDKGMVMSGGGAMLRNIDKLLTQVTGVPCHVAESPLDCVALGTGLALEHFDFFKKSLTLAV